MGVRGLMVLTFFMFHFSPGDAIFPSNRQQK